MGKRRDVHGFSLLELVAVIAIMLIASAIGFVTVTTVLETSRLRGTANRYSQLLQTARARAAADDRFYSVYVQPAAGANPALAYVDIEPRQVNGVSGKGAPPAGSPDPRDPTTTFSPRVVMQPVAAAPGTANLKNLFCGNCNNPNMIKNTWANVAPTWGPDGMPCEAKPSIDGSATVCNSAGGPVAYVTYFQSQTNNEWTAVTVSPAGRVKAWFYNNGTATWTPI